MTSSLQSSLFSIPRSTDIRITDQFTDQEVAGFKVNFNLFDTDHDGAIGSDVLGTLIRSLGLNPTEGELNDIISEIKNENGTIDFPEFLEILARQMKHTTNEDALREAFRIFDKEGNGHISSVELRHILTTLGEKVPEEEVDEMMKAIEINDNDQVNYEELVTTMFPK